MYTLVSDGSPTLSGACYAVPPRAGAQSVFGALTSDPPPRGVLARTRP